MSVRDVISQAMKIYQKEGVIPLLYSIYRFVKYNQKIKTPFKIFVAKLRQIVYEFRYEDATPNPYKLISVDPQDIEYWADPELRFKFTFSEFGTQIVGGDWDTDRLYLRPKQTRYRKMETSLREHFEEGIPWEETEIYRYVSNRTGVFRYDREYIETRLEELNQVHDHISRNGYKSQRELRADDTAPLSANSDHPEIPAYAPPEIHEIAIGITRDGKLAWFFAGHHRLLLAKIIGLDSIPVRVVVRHKEWQAIRSEVANATSVAELSDEARTYLDHPDVRDLAPITSGEVVVESVDHIDSVPTASNSY